MTDKRLEKLRCGTIKMRELEVFLTHLGFHRIGGKGSHRKWVLSGCDPIILASHDKEVKPYMTKYVLAKLEEAGLINKDEPCNENETANTAEKNPNT